MSARCDRTLSDLVVREAPRHVRASVGLVYVPDLVAALEPEHGREAVQAALLCAARAERLELQPESGLGRLTAAELARCPPGPQGTRLSWARLPATAPTDRERALRELLACVRRGRR